jgi:rhodanese-related sulfurtransferase
MKTRLNTLFAALLVTALTTVTSIAADAGGVKHVDAKAAAKLLKEDPKIVVLDIRTKKEFDRGHIKDAKNINFFGDDFEADIKKLPTDKTYLVHCATGGRSTKSLPIFKKLGFKSIVHLDGGFKAWEKAGEPVHK